MLIADYRMGNSQALTGSLAHILGGKEGIENPGNILLGDSLAQEFETFFPRISLGFQPNTVSTVELTC